jgi:hypothetical protein
MGAAGSMMRRPPLPSATLRRSAPTRFLLAGLAAVCTLVLVALWWYGRGGSPALAPHAIPAARAADAGAAVPAAEAETGRDVAPPPRTAVTGIVLGDDRQPLAGIPVSLQRLGEAEPPKVDLRLLEPKRITGHRTIQADTDEGGGFSFEGLEPARYRVKAGGWEPTVSDEVEVARGEVRHCELRFDRVLVRLWGRLRRANEPAQHVQIRGLRNGRDAAFHVLSDEHGDYRLFVVPGRYSLHVLSASQPKDAFLATLEHEVLLPATVREYRCDLDLPWTGIEASVVTELRGSSHKIEFTAEGRRADGRPVRLERQSPDGRPMGFADLPYGEWTIAARSPMLATGAPQRVELTRATPMIRVAIPAREAGIVRLHLCDAQGRPQTLPAAALPALVANGIEFAAVDIGEELPGTARRGECGYVGVPPGPAALRLDDGETDAEVRFLPFDPAHAPTAAVAAGDVNRIDLQIERRALVELRAAKASGSEDLDAEVTVQVGRRTARRLDGSRASRWLGYLPPGEYTAVVRRGDRRTEERFAVGRANLQLRLRR